MDGEVIKIEILKAGLKIVGDAFSKVLDNINKKRLEDKKLKREEKVDTKKVELFDTEKIRGVFHLNLEQTYENIAKHIEEVKRWSDGIKFSDLEKKRSLSSVYVQLDTYLLPVKRHLSKTEKDHTTELEKAVLSGMEHCVILGQPGAGKTTSLKKICEIVSKGGRKIPLTFPILLRLRDLDELKTFTPIFDHISKIISFEFDFADSKDPKYSGDVQMAKEETMFSFLNYVSPILILDGFDELRNAAEKNIVIKELRRFAEKLNNCKIVLSCRTGEFNYELDHSNTYEIAPLNDDQIELFVKKWLKDEEKAQDFLQKVRNSPFADTSIKPLSLAHLCVIYQRIGNIPDQPKTIYRKVVNLLIEEWDEQRSIIRESIFKGFQTDQKFEFLTHLSYVLTTVYKSSSFSLEQFRSAYEKICEYHNLPSGQASSVVRELESHTGLFLESGYEKFEFVHKSIQEYLAADYLVKLPSPISVRNDFEYLGSELAIAVSISSNSSLYYIELILNYFSHIPLSNSFYSSFIARIISENPSFNQDELVSSATLVLLSRWINPENRNINEFRYRPISDEFYDTFSKLAVGLRLNEQKVKISKFYKYRKDILDGTFVELTRILLPQDHRRLPSKIYLPMEFYMGFNT